MYADDIVVFCPSHKGLQALINICGQYGSEHDIMFHVSKTMCMSFKAKMYKSLKGKKGKAAVY